jgi:hypothetical protein
LRGVERLDLAGAQGGHGGGRQRGHVSGVQRADGVGA